MNKELSPMELLYRAYAEIHGKIERQEVKNEDNATQMKESSDTATNNRSPLALLIEGYTKKDS